MTDPTNDPTPTPTSLPSGRIAEIFVDVTDMEDGTYSWLLTTMDRTGGVSWELEMPYDLDVTSMRNPDAVYADGLYAAGQLVAGEEIHHPQPVRTPAHPNDEQPEQFRYEISYDPRGGDEPWLIRNQLDNSYSFWPTLDAALEIMAGEAEAAVPPAPVEPNEHDQFNELVLAINEMVSQYVQAWGENEYQREAITRAVAEMVATDLDILASAWV